MAVWYTCDRCEENGPQKFADSLHPPHKLRVLPGGVMVCQKCFDKYPGNSAWNDLQTAVKPPPLFETDAWTVIDSNGKPHWDALDPIKIYYEQNDMFEFWWARGFALKKVLVTVSELVASKPAGAP